MEATSLIAGKLSTSVENEDYCSCTYFVSYHSNMTWQLNITYWTWVIIHTLQFTFRLGSLTIRSTACYVTVDTCISNQVSYMKTSQLYLQQSQLSIPMCKYLQTCILIPQWPLFFYPVRRPPYCVTRNVRYGSQSTHRDNEHDGVSNRQHPDCLPNCLFRRRSKRTPKLLVTGLSLTGRVAAPHQGLRDCFLGVVLFCVWMSNFIALLIITR